ncbi:MAG: flagellar export protein FliJ [Syntrophomonadaceae bacterium]|jgi:flagellar FliJ protein
MKVFYFRLQTKLDICQRQEQMAREEMQKKIAARNQILQELEVLKTRFQAVHKSITELEVIPGQFPRMLMERQYISVLKQHIDVAEQNLAKAHKEVEEVRMVVLERIRETKTLEKLKEKAWRRYLQELLLEEQKHLDEVASSASHRRSF